MVKHEKKNEKKLMRKIKYLKKKKIKILLKNKETKKKKLLKSLYLQYVLISRCGNKN